MLFANSFSIKIIQIMWRVSKSSIRNSCVVIGAATATVAATATNRTPSFAPFSPYPRISLCEVEKSGLSKTKDSKSLDDCLNPACHSTMDLLKKFNMKTRKKKAPIVPTTNESEPNPYCTGCPADKDVQGRGTWQLIHSIASTYPQVPTEAEKRHMDNFLHSLSMVYPCPYCAKDFQERIVLFPPR